MGVYIKGMEMPNNCRECPLEDAYEGYNCRIVEQSANWGLEERPSWCPLVPVPPHGRLVDADALLTDKAVGTKIAGWGKMYHETCIEYAPTIIPADPPKEEHDDAP